MTTARQKVWNELTLFVVALMVFSMVCTFYLTAETLPKDLTGVNLVSENFIGCVICMIIYISIYFDKRMNLSSVSLQFMIFFEFVRLIADVNSYVGDDAIGYSLMDTLNHYILFCSAPLIFVAMWAYIRSMSDLPTDKNTVYDFVFCVCFIINAILIVPSVNDCWAYTMQNSAFSTEGPSKAFLLIIGLPVLEMIMCGILIFTHVKNRRDRFHYSLALVISAVAIVLQILHPSSNNLTLGLLFVVFLTYGNTYVNHGYELALKRNSVRSLKQTMYVSQLQPSFVSTTLMKIRDLPGNPQEMKEAIVLFDKYLHNNFKSAEETAIPFSKELEHVQLYVGLEKLRFKDKLNVNFDIEDEDFEIPPLILQMVVENAIKHGITKKENGGTVNITTEKNNTDHVITVKDDGVGFDVNQPVERGGRNHIGIANSKKRLSEILGGRITIVSEINKGTVATITIPRNDVN